PKRTVAGYYNGTIPWVKSGEVNAVNIFSSEEKITDEGLRNSSAKLVEPGAILVAMYGATAGKVGRLHIEATTNQAVLSVRSKNSNVISNDYLFWLLTFASEELIKQCQGAAQPNLSKQLIDGYQILYPSITEQQKIAEVLSTVNKKIDLIDQKIAETEKLKTGLMQKLFSEGVGVQDENGNWQPHTEFSSDLLPSSWEVGEVIDFLELQRGHDLPVQKRMGGSVPIIGSNG
ncbi:restriction endonuclease subunit S, partial [Vibrio parahaemolyticus]